MGIRKSRYAIEFIKKNKSYIQDSNISTIDSYFRTSICITPDRPITFFIYFSLLSILCLSLLVMIVIINILPQIIQINS